MFFPNATAPSPKPPTAPGADADVAPRRRAPTDAEAQPDGREGFTPTAAGDVGPQRRLTACSGTAYAARRQAIVSIDRRWPAAVGAVTGKSRWAMYSEDGCGNLIGAAPSRPLVVRVSYQAALPSAAGVDNTLSLLTSSDINLVRDAMFDAESGNALSFEEVSDASAGKINIHFRLQATFSESWAADGPGNLDSDYASLVIFGGTDFRTKPGLVRAALGQALGLVLPGRSSINGLSLPQGNFVDTTDSTVMSKNAALCTVPTAYMALDRSAFQALYPPLVSPTDTSDVRFDGTADVDGVYIPAQPPRRLVAQDPARVVLSLRDDGSIASRVGAYVATLAPLSAPSGGSLAATAGGNLFGSSNDEVLQGSAGVDYIDGGGGNDDIYGGGGTQDVVRLRLDGGLSIWHDFRPTSDVLAVDGAVSQPLAYDASIGATAQTLVSFGDAASTHVLLVGTKAFDVGSIRQNYAPFTGWSACSSTAAAAAAPFVPTYVPPADTGSIVLPPAPPPPHPATTNVPLVAGIAGGVGGALLLTLTGVGAWWAHRRRRQRPEVAVRERSFEFSREVPPPPPPAPGAAGHGNGPGAAAHGNGPGAAAASSKQPAATAPTNGHDGVGLA